MSETPPLPERIDLSQADDPRDVVHRAVACLAQGGIIGMATETVYGLQRQRLASDGGVTAPGDPGAGCVGPADPAATRAR